MNYLYTEIPVQTRLSLCNKNNCKVYFYQSSDVCTTNYGSSSNSHPNIVTVNISKDDKSEMNDITENNVKKELVEHSIEFKQDRNDDDDDKVCSNEAENDLNEIEDIDSLVNENCKEVFDSDSSMDEILSKYKEKRTEMKKSETKFKNLPQIDIVDFKNKLRKKFEKNGVVKDESGNVIDIEKVLYNLDKFSEKTIKTVRKLCKGAGPFQPSAIRKLSEIQGSFAKFEHMFTIERLHDPTLIKAEFERRREYPNYLKYQHRCDSCIRGYMNKKMLDYHIKIHHDTTAPFECELCHMRLRTQRSFTQHLAKHTTVYSCKLCTNFVSNNWVSMTDHHRKHNGGKYVCEHCGIEFASRSAFYSHVNTHKPRHLCELCACAFSKPTALTQHKTLKHFGEVFIESDDNKKCDKCNILFISHEVYDKHLSVMHKEPASIPGLSNRGHPGRKGVRMTYSCHLCDWKGHGLLTRRKHYATDHPEGNNDMSKMKYLCPECGKQFQFFSPYKYHMNKHTGARPFECTKCPKAFYSPNILYTHMQRHLPPSRECQHCNKKFTTSTGLATHLRIHINDRRYKCDICGNAFIHASSLKEHVNGVHYNIRRKKGRQEIDSDYFE